MLNIELKVAVYNFKTITENLEKIGARHIEALQQIDIYYNLKKSADLIVIYL